ncbi:hypothetical protein CLOM_g20255 [Closterium sp. NIES-68]|nr:hypothetical protein CLOM_g20255 [Closterium sp. NIES-68]GJP64345.1 hypothetical protein CLOP_g21351 [Closterium sp. NIES-67]
MDPFGKGGGSKGATAAAAAADRRGSLRQRKVAADVVAVMMDEGTRKRAAAARLEALESDYTGVDATVDDDDEAFNAEEELVQEGFAPAKRVSRPGKRRTRQAAAAVVSRASKRTAKTFAELLEEANLEALPPGTPSYLTAAMGPPTVTSARRFCSVCGTHAPYTCPRCGSRFCCVSCQRLHNETRCLKFVM